MNKVALFVIAIIWIVVVLFLAVFLGRTPKGRAWLSIVLRYRRFQLAVAGTSAVVFFIVAGYALFPKMETVESQDPRLAYIDYSKRVVEDMAASGMFSIDSSCRVVNPLPELAYSLPALLDAYHAEVRKPTLPRLLRLDDSLFLSFDGYKQFKNRGIRIVKRVQKRLGPRYTIKISSSGMNHRLELAYKGTLWDGEQLCSLPVMEAALRENVDPALLMSIIRHVSNFKFDYRGPRGGAGLLALDSGDGLQQVYIGAGLLSRSLRQEGNKEDAVMAFYPVRERGTIHEEWRNNPLKQSWIEEVLKDVSFYRENGLVPVMEDSLSAEDEVPTEELVEDEDSQVLDSLPAPDTADEIP